MRRIVFLRTLMTVTRTHGVDINWFFEILARNREARFYLVSGHSGKAVTKWNKACDKRLLWLINYTNQRKDDRPFCHAGNEFEDCKHGLFQHAFFASDLQDSNSRSGVILWIFESRTLVPISLMCKRVPQLCRNVNHIAWCKCTNTFFTSASVFGMRIGDWFAHHVGATRGWSEMIVTVILTQMQKIVLLEHIDHVPATILHQSSSNTTLLVWGQCGSDSHNYGRTKAKLEARHQNPQGWFGLVIW